MHNDPLLLTDAELVEKGALHVVGLTDDGQKTAVLRGLGFSLAQAARLWRAIEIRAAVLDVMRHPLGQEVS